ncbi:MAG: HU family DNA-binding protein [Bacteroidaceae bacterium]|nr:HU family DNA-binding protein [Bacteroidaceae bacterium]MDE6633854.1 HU family DNA-binding protein [Bacteroidaceae bacterium]MDE7166479.1 HU family DNA-binding protein [Bacteroidaceae bacterium]
MNKTDLIAQIAEGAGLSKVDAKKAMDVAIDAVKAALAAGDKVQIPGVLTLSVEERAERKGINPATQQTIVIPAKKVVKVKVGTELAAVVK